MAQIKNDEKTKDEVFQEQLNYINSVGEKAVESLKRWNAALEHVKELINANKKQFR